MPATYHEWKCKDLQGHNTVTLQCEVGDQELRQQVHVNGRSCGGRIASLSSQAFSGSYPLLRHITQECRRQGGGGCLRLCDKGGGERIGRYIVGNAQGLMGMWQACVLNTKV